ncbi:MAG TPA: DNA-3-methyladenine glycosylase 2 family protein [Nevskiaceae bacterium]
MIPRTVLERAETELARTDEALAALIARHGPCQLGQRTRPAFHVLCTSIINQQLSTKAADAIQDRVAGLLGAPLFTPAAFRGIEAERLRAVGLSRSKSRWLIDIAARVDRGEFSFAELAQMEDERAIATLDALPGIGRWSAEMFLIFALDRLDVFSLGDVGLRRGVARLHHGGKPMSDRQTLRVVKRWAPWRSVASWFLWRIDDTDAGAWA